MPPPFSPAIPIIVTEPTPALLLASRSPRRRELLEQAGIAFRVVDVLVDETVRPGEAPAAYVARVAADKARAAVQALPVDGRAPVLAADTSVVVDGKVLGKPADSQHAAAMLRRLSGRTHEVMTAVALADGARLHSALSTSRVRFRALSDADIDAYVATGEPVDKAGAYAIQGIAACFIEHLDGSYSGVMGLPLFETAQLLAQVGILLPPRSGVGM